MPLIFSVLITSNPFCATNFWNELIDQRDQALNPIKFIQREKK